MSTSQDIIAATARLDQTLALLDETISRVAKRIGVEEIDLFRAAEVSFESTIADEDRNHPGIVIAELLFIAGCAAYTARMVARDAT